LPESTPTGDAARIRYARLQLPPHRGKLARMQDHVEGAVGGLKDWIELRIELVQAQIQEFVDARTEEAKFGAIIGVFAALAALFFLITLGFAFSALLRWLLGWGQLAALTGGFFIVVLILALVAFVAYRRSPFSKN
jgi:hypothetical protein